jgi:hypothetical protein
MTKMIKNIAVGPAQRIAHAVACALALASGSALSANTDSQTVSFSIQEINEIDVAAGTVSLTVNTATAGSQPSAATAPSSYSITSNADADSKKITADLDTPMPPGVTLQVNVAAPSAGSTSLGTVVLTTSAVDVVTGIEAVAATGVAINYTLSATVAADPIADSRQVTYTIDSN